MRILLVQDASWVPTFGGASKANRHLLEGLASRGNLCRAIVPFCTMHEGKDEADILQDLATRGLSCTPSGENITTFVLNKIAIDLVRERSPVERLRYLQLGAHLRKTIDAFDPDCILMAGEDRGQLLLSDAVTRRPGKTVYLARSSATLGLGPMAFFPNRFASKLLQSVGGIVCNSRYLSNYVKRYTGRECHVADVSTYGNPEVENGGRERYLVTMLNPCTVKGIDIFLGLADRMNDVQFAAVPGWGTTLLDLDRLSLRPNITIIPPRDDIYSIFATTKVLLFPSVWDEAFGRTIVEAMLCGVPVIASDVGGTAEAKLGVPYLIPVRPIVRFLNTFEGRNVPKAVVPEQDLSPWFETLQLLLSSTSHYNELKDQSASVAREYVAGLDDRAIDTIISETVARC